MSPADNLLGEFLRARRERLDPDALHLPDYGRRRVDGLRREELAMLAGISTQYYSRLERGTDRNPSAQVIDALARALQLDDPARAHLRRLVTAPAAPAPRRRGAEHLAPGMRELLGRLSDPAVVIGRYRDVLATNPIASLINPGYAAGTNLLRHTFIDPEGREVYLDWEETAQGAVSGLRSGAGYDAEDPQLAELVGELSLGSEDFARIWARHDARDRTSGFKRFRSPLVGEIALNYVVLDVTAAPDQALFAYFPEPDSRDEQSLALLRSMLSD